MDGQARPHVRPYAGFKTNFLKQGSLLDLPLSLRLNNIYPMSRAGWTTWTWSKYLVSSYSRTRKPASSLCTSYPEADGGEWELIEAGQRVQIMKKDAKKGGILQFGTEVVSAADLYRGSAAHPPVLPLGSDYACPCWLVSPQDCRLGSPV